MPYTTIDDVRTILKPELYDYPSNIDDAIGWAESEVHSIVGGVFPLRFDNTALYASVPSQIRWTTALLTAYRLWDRQVPLEGQTDDTAAEKWRSAAQATLMALRDGDSKLTLEDGTLVQVSGSSVSAPRYADFSSDDDYPFFKRSQAREW